MLLELRLIGLNLNPLTSSVAGQVCGEACLLPVIRGYCFYSPMIFTITRFLLRPSNSP